MELIATAGANREPAPAGTHLAVCFGLIDLGTQTDTYQGKPKVGRKAWFWWELTEETREDGKPVTVGTFYTVSLSDKANLRKVLESWRGKPFTVEELKGFNIGNIVGAPCMLTIIHEPRQSGGVRDKVSSVSGVPKGMPRPALRMPRTTLSLAPDKFDRAVYDALPNFLKDMIAKSPEGQRLGLGGQKQYPTEPPSDWDENGKPIRSTNGVTTYDDSASDIPF